MTPVNAYVGDCFSFCIMSGRTWCDSVSVSAGLCVSVCNPRMGEIKAAAAARSFC